LKIQNQQYYFLLFTAIILTACQKDPVDNTAIFSQYSGSYKNINYNEVFLKEFTPGIYAESEIPDEIRQLDYGRIEISFRYDGGGISSFMPLFYYGSMNKNKEDDALEKTKFHLAVEIGHYNVIPVPVEYLFYTISSFRQPEYCRDSWCPIVAGIEYTLYIDKRPEGIILQLKKGDTIINAFPHAFFPDSAQMFFSDVTSYIHRNMGDSLQTVLMVGKGFAGFDKGLHEFHGQVNSVRIYAYNLTQTLPDYVLDKVKNQLSEDQKLNYSIIDPDAGTDKFIRFNYEFWPYKLNSAGFVPSGEKQTGKSNLVVNKLSQTTIIGPEKVGFYKLTMQTVSSEGTVLKTSQNPFEIWVYPKEWYFDFY
jgi:hypothetical protein